QDRFDMSGQPGQQSANGARLTSIHAIVKTTPARLPQPQYRVVRGAIADEPDTLPMSAERFLKLLELVLEIEYRGDDGEMGDGHPTSPGRNHGREVDRQVGYT